MACPFPYINSLCAHVEYISTHIEISLHRTMSQSEGDCADRFLDSRFRGFSSEAKNTLLVVVILITTATYQSALSPPGGLWQDDSNASKDNCSSSCNKVSDVHTAEHTAGTAILASRIDPDPDPYTLFVIANSLGFYMSMYMIYILTVDFPLLLELHISLMLFSLNYTTCMYTLLPPRYERLRTICITVGGIYVLLVLGMFVVGTRRLSYRRGALMKSETSPSEQVQERNSTPETQVSNLSRRINRVLSSPT